MTSKREHTLDLLDDKLSKMERVREQLNSLTVAYNKLTQYGLTETALIVLIREAAPRPKPTRQQIKQVLRGVENVEAFLFAHPEVPDVIAELRDTAPSPRIARRNP